MPPQIPLALTCLACLGVSDFLYRFGQRYGLKPGPFMMIQNLAYIATAFAISSMLGELQFSPALALGLVNGIMAFLAFLFILLALKDGEATALVPIIRLNFAVTGLLTVVFLSEPLTGARIVAIFLVAFAILLMGPGVKAALGSTARLPGRWFLRNRLVSSSWRCPTRSTEKKNSNFPADDSGYPWCVAS